MAKWRQSEKPWERREGESPKAYEAFCAYLEMGPNRSIRAVGQKLDKSRQLLGRWSAAHQWVDRAAAYDADLRQKAYEAARKETQKMQTRQIETAIIFQKKALEALDKIDVESLEPRDILRFFEVAAKIERETRAQSEAQAAPESKEGNGPAGVADSILAAYRSKGGGSS